MPCKSLLWLLYVIVLMLLIFIKETTAAAECSADDDCVPLTCCHATSCVPARLAEQNCSDTMCDGHCRPFTLDCGGSCRCNSRGKCSSFLRAGVAPLGAPPKKSDTLFHKYTIKVTVRKTVSRWQIQQSGHFSAPEVKRCEKKGRKKKKTTLRSYLVFNAYVLFTPLFSCLWFALIPGKEKCM
jgi:hypothetical protein